jgi:hypothetical protein
MAWVSGVGSTSVMAEKGSGDCAMAPHPRQHDICWTPHLHLADGPEGGSIIPR